MGVPAAPKEEFTVFDKEARVLVEEDLASRVANLPNQEEWLLEVRELNVFY